ncbi:sodium-dependent transporter [Peptoniphilus equinus]|uniref:Sodium-dependent transporter n=1 Tax=Peptoniphilus equinus TaxID=3016343 RepID=A0ABY7QR80_9FIRM|nr:sodium-dependent transporter [Peptoniphilus equinus]WBW49295.1 sodium-dependent transporter [Peptoniphilus equinus]
MKNESKFSSKLGFILSAVGSAVGMANVWGFPYKLQQGGGAAFLLIYLFFVVVFGYVALSAEFAVGRRAGTGTLGAYEAVWSERGFTTIGRFIGFLPLIGSFCIAIGYAVIISYITKALFQSLDGTLMNLNSEAWFGGFSSTAFSVVPFHLFIVVVTIFTCVKGASSIEKSNRIMMPAFFILFLILAVRVALIPGAFEGYKFMLQPDFSEAINVNTIVTAMGQAFFSLSVTGSGMIVCGAYLNRKEDIVSASKQTALFDTIAAAVAAFVMVPATFAYGMEQSAGPQLLFVVLPKILQEIPAGRLFAVILYVAVIFGGISSLQNMLEVVAESLMHRFTNLKRIPTLVVLGLLLFGIGIFMEPISQWGPWMDFVSIYIIPIGATIGAITWFWVMKKEDLLDEINMGAARHYGTFWHNIGRFVYVPFAILICVIALVFRIAF